MFRVVRIASIIIGVTLMFSLIPWILPLSLNLEDRVFMTIFLGMGAAVLAAIFYSYGIVE
jgi:hypothetical protein